MNNILMDEQFGFKAGYSCEAQLISVVEDIELAMDDTYFKSRYDFH